MAKNTVITLAAIALFSLSAFRCSMVWGEHVFGTQNVTLYPVADSYVNSSEPNANYGDKKTIYIQGADNCLYVKFDLGSIPSNAVITSARLYLDFLMGSQWSGPLGLAYVGCFYCSDLSWTETGLTFSNRPSFASQPTSTRSFGYEYAGYKSWSVTEDANAALTSGYLTEVLRFTSGSGRMLVASRESNNKPELFVEYTTEPICNITLESLQDTAVTSNQGYVRFSGQESPLPLGIRAVVGQYPVEYLGGYQFASWRTEGGLSVLDAGERATQVTVSSDGTLIAVGNAGTFTYRYDDGTKESTSGATAGNMLGVRVTPLFVGELESASFLISELGYGGNAFRVRVMDSEWNDLIPAVEAAPSAPGWLEVDLSQHHLVVRKDFYIVMEYLFDYNPDLGVDTSSSNPGRSWGWNGTTWRTSYGNYIVRCTTASALPARVIGVLNVSVTPGYPSAGGRVTVAGAIKPVVAGTSIRLTYEMPDSTAMVRTVATQPNGTFRDLLVPLQVGSWKVVASWDGDASYEGSETAPCTFQVSKASSYISCSTSWQVEFGQAANISGWVSPSVSLPIRLEYSTDGGTTWSRLADLASDPDGTFSCLWTPLRTGYVKVRAIFEGNEAITGSTSYPASLNVAKATSKITCAADPSSPTLGSRVKVSGTVDPARITTVKIEWRKQWGSWQEVATVTSAADGLYQEWWTPNATGSLEVRASCTEDENHKAATSSSVSVTVGKMQSSISCTAQPDQVAEGEKVTISGLLDPGAAGLSVKLILTRPDDSTYSVRFTSGEGGSYEYVLNPSVAGAWSAKASWDGDERHLPAESQPAHFSVPELLLAVSPALWLLGFIGHRIAPNP